MSPLNRVWPDGYAVHYNAQIILSELGKELLFKNKEFKTKYLEYLKAKVDVVTAQLSLETDT